MDPLGPFLALKAPVFEATVCQMFRLQAQLVQMWVQSMKPVVLNLWIHQDHQKNSRNHSGLREDN